jgi:hypothetical protein
MKQTEGKWNSDLMNTQVNVKKISSSSKTANQKLIKHKQDYGSERCFDPKLRWTLT